MHAEPILDLEPNHGSQQLEQIADIFRGAITNAMDSSRASQPAEVAVIAQPQPAALSDSEVQQQIEFHRAALSSLEEVMHARRRGRKSVAFIAENLRLLEEHKASIERLQDLLPAADAIAVVPVLSPAVAFCPYAFCMF